MIEVGQIAQNRVNLKVIARIIPVITRGLKNWRQIDNRYTKFL
jgi:hypothetical protein